MSFPRRTTWAHKASMFLALIAVFAMGYYLRVPILSEEKRKLTADEVTEFSKALHHGSPDERHAALLKLIEAHAEDQLNACLGSDDALTVNLATGGIWECWLNERGLDARREIDKGI